MLNHPSAGSALSFIQKPMLVHKAMNENGTFKAFLVGVSAIKLKSKCFTVV